MSFQNQATPLVGYPSAGILPLPKCSNTTISNCSACQIPLASYCSRTKMSVPLSTKLIFFEGPSLMKFICTTYDIELSQLELLSYVKNDDLELCGYCTRMFEKLYHLREKIATVIRQTRSVLARLMPLSTHDGRGRHDVNSHCEHRSQDSSSRTNNSSVHISHQNAKDSAGAIQHDTSDTFSDRDLVETLYALGSAHTFGTHLPQQLTHGDDTHGDHVESLEIIDSSTNDLRNPSVNLDSLVHEFVTGTGSDSHRYGEMLLPNNNSQRLETDNPPTGVTQLQDLQDLHDDNPVNEPPTQCSTQISGAGENRSKTSRKRKKPKRSLQPKNPKEFKCTECDRIFPNLLGLNVHAVTHKRQVYTCDGCKRKFKIEKHYLRHLETARCNEKKHACPTCGKLFKHKDKVKRHLISMHSESKPFSCESCGKGFRSAADLKFHEVNAHICGDSKNYQCEECGKRFKSFETLKSHETYSHKMEKKYFCSNCGKGFPLLATLKLHEVSHSTDRPYMCTYCGRTYKHFSDLKSHEVVHYKDEEKPFGCPICGAKFHRKDVLRLHQTREQHFGPDLPVQTRAKKLKVTQAVKPQEPPASQNLRSETSAAATASSSNTPAPLYTDAQNQLIAVPPQITNSTSQSVALSNPVIVNPISTSASPFPDSSAIPETNLNSSNQPSFNLSSQVGNEVITDLLRIMYEIP